MHLEIKSGLLDCQVRVIKPGLIACDYGTEHSVSLQSLTVRYVLQQERSRFRALRLQKTEQTMWV